MVLVLSTEKASGADPGLLRKLQKTPEELKSKKRKAVALLEIHHLLGIQVLETYLAAHEMIWDQ